MRIRLSIVPSDRQAIQAGGRCSCKSCGRCDSPDAIHHVPMGEQRLIVLERRLHERIEHVHEFAGAAQLLPEPHGRSALSAPTLRAVVTAATSAPLAALRRAMKSDGNPAATKVSANGAAALAIPSA